MLRRSIQIATSLCMNLTVTMKDKRFQQVMMYRLAAFSLLLLLALVTVADPQQPTAIVPTAQEAWRGEFPKGVFELKAPITIPQQQRQIAVPPPFNAKQYSYPAGYLFGKGQFVTVLRFAPTITGQLIKTEGFGEGHAGKFWNENNTQGDTSSGLLFVHPLTTSRSMARQDSEAIPGGRDHTGSICLVARTVYVFKAMVSTESDYDFFKSPAWLSFSTIHHHPQPMGEPLEFMTTTREF